MISPTMSLGVLMHVLKDANAHDLGQLSKGSRGLSLTKRRNISGITRPHLRANRPAITVNDQTQNHLFQVRSEVLGEPVLSERLAAFAIERQAGGIHEHDRKIAEQIATPFKQLFLNLIF